MNEELPVELARVYSSARGYRSATTALVVERDRLQDCINSALSFHRATELPGETSLYCTCGEVYPCRTRRALELK